MKTKKQFEIFINISQFDYTYDQVSAIDETIIVLNEKKKTQASEAKVVYRNIIKIIDNKNNNKG